jgi:stage IV sporulation protein B
MRTKKKRIILCILTPILAFLTVCMYLRIDSLPSEFYIRENGNIKNGSLMKVLKQRETTPTLIGYDEQTNADVKLLGIIPIKSVSLKTVPDLYLYPGGISVGVKVNTKGVLVVAISDVEGDSGKITSPAVSSGVMIGDNILSINNIEIKNAEMLSREINNCQGKTLNMIIERKGKTFTKKIEPIKNTSENKYKVGLWVRDSTAGIGTLTFYDAASKRFAALGHPVTDVDTGTILNIGSGDLIASSIINIRKGIKGTPGELRGIFVDENKALGSINKNTESGIFGNASEDIVKKLSFKPMRIALRDEIKEGKAQIITTIDEDGPKLYDIEIEKLLDQDTAGTKSMLIKITDKRLLERTGGIVQGMSGSPIIQNDKIIGAVTHVLVNKPDTGYGIYIEWMLKDSEILS